MNPRNELTAYLQGFNDGYSRAIDFLTRRANQEALAAQAASQQAPVSGTDLRSPAHRAAVAARSLPSTEALAQSSAPTTKRKPRRKLTPSEEPTTDG